MERVRIWVIVSLYLGVVASANTDLGHWLSFAFYFSLKWVKSPLDERAKFSCLVCDSLLAYLTHPPAIKCAEGQGHRRSTCCLWLMGFTASLLSQHSVPSSAQPPGCVHLLCHDVVNENSCVASCIYRIIPLCQICCVLTFVLLCLQVTDDIQSLWWSLEFRQHGSQPKSRSVNPHLFDTFVWFCCCPHQVFVVHLKIVCVLACSGACVWLHLIFLLCLVCCHKPL